MNSLVQSIRLIHRRWRWRQDYEKSLNRRAEVEQELFESASGQRPLPNAEQCRKLALKLGIPAQHQKK